MPKAFQLQLNLPRWTQCLPGSLILRYSLKQLSLAEEINEIRTLYIYRKYYFGLSSLKMFSCINL